MKFTDFYEAWWYLNELPLFNDPRYPDDLYVNTFEDSLCIEVQKVNPINSTIEDNEALNTKIEVWLECGEPYIDDNNNIGHYHNPNYDCGGDTFEEAIINLANIINDKHKNT